MGSAASAGVSASLAVTQEDELRQALQTTPREHRAKLMKTLADLDQQEESPDEKKYGEVVKDSLEPIGALFKKIDFDSSGYLDKLELKGVISRYNGEKFDEKQFFGWFDVHGVGKGVPDGKVDITEFQWYLADVALSFGDTVEAAQKCLPAILTDFGEKVAAAVAEKKYGEIVKDSLEPIGALFKKIDVDSSGYLDKLELKGVVEKYNGEKFDEKQFFGWFDAHGDAGVFDGRPDGKLDPVEFQWYLADVAMSFGDTVEEAQKSLPAVVKEFGEKFDEVVAAKQKT